MKKGLYILLAICLVFLICNAPLTDAVIYPYDGNYPVAIPNPITERAYGEMWNYSANSTAWTFEVDTSSIYYNLTNLQNGSLNGFNFIDANQTEGGSYLTTEVSGIYQISFSMSFESVAVGGLYGIGISKNFDIDNSRNCYARRVGTGSVGNIGITCLLDLIIGDSINIQVENEESPSKDIKVHTVNLNLVKVGD